MFASHVEYCDEHEPLSAFWRHVVQVPVLPELPLLLPLHVPELQDWLPGHT